MEVEAVVVKRKVRLLKVLANKNLLKALEVLIQEEELTKGLYLRTIKETQQDGKTVYYYLALKFLINQKEQSGVKQEYGKLL